MITTRENLLIRPWQQRKYDDHKKKVLSATPVIDNRSPPFRSHVAVKLKKLQKESERAQKIERDNLILLQKLNHIMTKHWLDNYLPPQPTFLSRVGIYRAIDSGIDMSDVASRSEYLEDQDVDEIYNGSKKKCRKSKCLACSPHKITEQLKVPEERVPWEPDRKPLRKRSRSVPPKKTPTTLPVIIEKPKSAASSAESRKRKKKAMENGEQSRKHQPTIELSKKKVKVPADLLLTRPNTISLSRGSLKLSVNFPSDTLVNFDKKRVGPTICRCLRNISLKS